MNHLAQGDSVDEFHRDEMRAIVFPDLKDLRDIWMVERSGGLRLKHKPLHAIAMRSNISGQDFQRHLAVELGVLRQIYFTHSARAELRDDLVMTKRCA